MPATRQLSEGEWMEVTRACSTLQIGRATLHRMNDRGLLQPGLHWLRTTPGKTGRILWNPGSIRRAMAGWSMPAEHHTARSVS